MPDEPQRVRTTDKALVRRLLLGDEAAFTQFFDGHFSRLYRFALRRTNGDADAAEEIVQKTLITAVRRLHTHAHAPAAPPSGIAVRRELPARIAQPQERGPFFRATDEARPPDRGLPRHVLASYAWRER